MKMKNELFNPNCNSRYICIFSSCCTLELFQEQMYQINLFTILIFLFLATMFSYRIIISTKTKKYKEDENKINRNYNINKSYSMNRSISYAKEDNNNLNLSMSFSHNRQLAQHLNQPKNHDYSFSFQDLKIILTIFIKIFIIQQLIIKLIEIIFIQNHFIKGDLEIYSIENITEDESNFTNDLVYIKISSILILEILLNIFSFSFFYIATQFLEFYKKYLIIFSIYSCLFLYNFYIFWTRCLIIYKSYFLSSIVCLIIILFVIINSIYSNSILFAKLNREDSINESNYHKEIIQNYSKKLSEDDRELYKETNRVFDMYKVLEIVEKIRINRKQIWNIGLVLIFVIFIFCFIFNISMLYRNFKISYLYTESNINSNDILSLNNLEYLNDINIKKIKRSIIKNRVEKFDFPKNVLLVMISNLDLKNLEYNEEFKEFEKMIKNIDKSGRLYKIKQNKSENLITNWISFFTGTLSNLNGIKGNILKSNKIGKFDSIFKRMKRNGVSSYIVGSPHLNIFMRNSFPDATLTNNLSDLNTINKLDLKINLKYSDEKRFQEILKNLNKNNDKYKIRKNINKNLNNSSELKNLSNDYNYQTKLNEKIHYIKKLYKEIDNETTLIILSDSTENSENNSYLPLIIAKKDSNFADNDFSLYSKEIIFQPADVASTICSLLNIEIPRDNQGKLNDEIVGLINLEEIERKLIYLDYREQQQKMNLKLIKFLSENSNQRFLKEYDDVNILYRPLDSTSAEFYYNEAENFNKIFRHVYEEVYSKELSENLIYSICISVSAIFFILLIIQYLTFADIVSIFSLSDSGKRNSFSFISAIIIFTIYYTISNFLFQNQILGHKISDQNFCLNYMTQFIIIPFFLSIFIQKIWFSLFYYSMEIKSETYPNKSFYFFSTNFMRNMNNTIFTENGMGYIYLYRIYSFIISFIISVFLFYRINQFSFFFSNYRIISFLVYKDENYLNLIKLNQILVLLITYQFSLLIYFFSYPNFNKIKQIFDSIFVLYDLKLINTLESGKTCEKDALMSLFVLDFVNFDNQSEWYYRKKHFDDEKYYPNFTDVINCIILIYF